MELELKLPLSARTSMTTAFFDSVGSVGLSAAVL
jgi:hypothetical protein